MSKAHRFLQITAIFFTLFLAVKTSSKDLVNDFGRTVPSDEKYCRK